MYSYSVQLIGNQIFNFMFWVFSKNSNIHRIALEKQTKAVKCAHKLNIDRNFSSIKYNE